MNPASAGYTRYSSVKIAGPEAYKVGGVGFALTPEPRHALIASWGLVQR